MKRKISALLALCMLCTSMTAGCSDKTASPGGTVNPDGKAVLPVSGAEVDAAVFADPFEVTFASVRTGGSDEVIEIFDKLSGIPNCAPSYKYFSADELDTQMNLALTAGEASSPYDMFRISLRSYREFAAKDLTLPLDEYLEKYNDVYHFDDIPESVWTPLEELGEIRGIPLTVNVQHMFYRSDLFEQYNLTPPETIDEWLELCEKLKDVPEIDYPIALALDKGNGAATEYVNMMYAAGEDFFDENERPIFNQEAGVACLEKLIELAAYCPPGVTSMTNDDTMVLMQTGKVGMLNTWASRASYMDDATVSSVVGKVAYSPAPLYAEGKYPYANLSTDYMVIPANIKGDHEAAFLALAEMTCDAAQEHYMSNSFISRQQPVKDHPEILESQPNAQAVSDTIAAGAQVGSFHPGFGSCWSILSTYVAMAIDGDMTAQEALDQAASECIVVLKDSGIMK